MNFVESIISAICSSALGVSKAFFSKVLSEISTLKDPTTLFDTIFSANHGGAEALDNAIFTIAICLGILFAMYSLISTMTTSNSRSAESPISVLFRMCIFMPLTIWSQSLCKVFYEIQSVFLGLLHDEQVTIDAAGVFDHMAEGFQGGADAIDGLFGTIIAVVFAIMLFVDLFKLCINIVEQYVIIGILAHLSPLALSTGCTRKTNQILSSWVNLFVSHLLIFVLVQWSIMVFATGCKNGLEMSGDGKAYGLITWIVALDAFLRISAHWEQILNKLGLKAIGAGGGVMGSILAAATGARALFRGGSNAIQTGLRMKNGTWAPRDRSILGAALSGVTSASIQNPGKASSAASGPITSAWASKLDSFAKKGKDAAMSDFNSGKAARVLSPGQTPEERAHNSAYKQTMDSLRKQEASKAQEAAKKDYFSGAGMQTFHAATSAKDAAYQDAYNSAYAKYQAGAVGAAMGVSSRPDNDSLKKAGVSFSENARNNAMYGVSAGNTRPFANTGSIPKETAMSVNVGGQHLSVGQGTSPDHASMKTANAMTAAVTPGVSEPFKGMSPYGKGESLNITEAGYAAFDAKSDAGSIRVSGTITNDKGETVSAFENADALLVKQNDANMALLDSGDHQAYQVNIGTEENPDFRMMFIDGSALVTTPTGEVRQDTNGNDISYKVSPPTEIFEGPSIVVDDLIDDAAEAEIISEVGNAENPSDLSNGDDPYSDWEDPSVDDPISEDEWDTLLGDLFDGE